ncbi:MULTISPECIES: DUF5316 family protein [Cohnella]|uniref:DUF5316 family protein n=1 Tax=Cohnella TaxID=329857 RepID=UPI00111AF3C1|nr:MULTISPECIES: DUF5316 family protein [Cohnella]MBN2981594.1 hypothetical protein [Cohnella algarum]
MDWLLYVGIIFLFISGILIGAWTTGTQQRGNYYSENQNERKLKRKLAAITALISLLAFIIYGCFYLL